MPPALPAHITALETIATAWTHNAALHLRAAAPTRMPVKIIVRVTKAVVEEVSVLLVLVMVVVVMVVVGAAAGRGPIL